MENTKELEQQAIKLATDDIDSWENYEVADYLGVETDEINYQYRNDAITKRAEELLELWNK